MFGFPKMAPQPTPTVHRRVLAPERSLPAPSDEWDGRCPECGETARLTSYLGNDDLRSEEHWWCARCMLSLNIRVVRLVARATSVKPRGQ